MTAKSHPAAMRFIPDQVSREGDLNNHVSSSSDMVVREPTRYERMEKTIRICHNSMSLTECLWC